MQKYRTFFAGAISLIDKQQNEYQMKSFLRLTALFSVIALVAFSAPSLSAKDPVKKGKATKLVDGFKEIKGTNTAGKEVKLSDYLLQDKYVLVDFWASWCGPCKEETPYVKAVNEKYAGKDLVVIGIAVSDKKADTIKAISDLGINYPQILEGDSAAIKSYGIRSIPNLYLFGPDGSVVDHGMRGKGIEQAVKKALGR